MRIACARQEYLNVACEGLCSESCLTVPLDRESLPTPTRVTERYATVSDGRVVTISGSLHFAHLAAFADVVPIKTRGAPDVSSDTERQKRVESVISLADEIFACTPVLLTHIQTGASQRVEILGFRGGLYGSKRKANTKLNRWYIHKHCSAPSMNETTGS